ncbi:MAG: hypothetical protein HY052_09480 [Proteobacteria bacterium]|nr:hypothetical protein [Pseudomonadota bacterium]
MNAIEVKNVSKIYKLYASPKDRSKNAQLNKTGFAMRSWKPALREFLESEVLK